ncbi:hypothetical protein SAMN06265222_11071 [Neorhodopirellula lusitana]|uniref:Uncharacterized protein n=1 Tax=Neorhodopirellula lusitana TaxID=445327 RepID=A0ABY1QFE4_9BACT|nr:hypothetical protein SAMN06265222_11071 [Neorhodopirellula lusitana]
MKQLDSAFDSEPYQTHEAWAPINTPDASLPCGGVAAFSIENIEEAETL